MMPGKGKEKMRSLMILLSSAYSNNEALPVAKEWGFDCACVYENDKRIAEGGLYSKRQV